MDNWGKILACKEGDIFHCVIKLLLSYFLLTTDSGRDDSHAFATALFFSFSLYSLLPFIQLFLIFIWNGILFALFIVFCNPVKDQFSKEEARKTRIVGNYFVFPPLLSQWWQSKSQTVFRLKLLLFVPFFRFIFSSLVRKAKGMIKLMICVYLSFLNACLAISTLNFTHTISSPCSFFLSVCSSDDIHFHFCYRQYRFDRRRRFVL